MPAENRRRQIWRIVRSIDFHGSGGCWIWTARTSEDGYGVASWGGKQHGAHRVVWWMFTGIPTPRGTELDHTCENPSCVNPKHLQLLTRADHVRVTRARIPGWRNANALKTHCKRGHALADAYLINGTRVCRHCRRDARIARRIRLPNAEKTHCPAGHPYSPENTYTTPRGGRQCRICKREAVRRCIETKRATALNMPLHRS